MINKIVAERPAGEGYWWFFPRTIWKKTKDGLRLSATIVLTMLIFNSQCYSDTVPKTNIWCEKNRCLQHGIFIKILYKFRELLFTKHSRIDVVLICPKTVRGVHKQETTVERRRRIPKSLNSQEFLNLKVMHYFVIRRIPFTMVLQKI